MEGNIWCVQDIVDEKGCICERVDTLNWLEINTLFAALPPIWKLMLKEDGDDDSSSDKSDTLFDEIIGCKKPIKVLYDKLIDDEFYINRYATRWLEEIPQLEIVRYREMFGLFRKCTHITKFRDFQYRLLLKKITTNLELFNWGKIDSNACEFCKVEIETIMHLLLQCNKIVSLIHLFIDICNKANVN